MSDAPPQTTPLIDPPAGELPVGTVLNGGQYKIKHVIASGGFGITYLASDNLGRDVALKECFPLGLAMRSSGRTVGAASTSTAESFTTARDLFLREARLLAGLQHPNVVHVQTLFEENGTAYMAMDFIHGHDLHTVVTKFPDRLTPGTVMDLARTLLGALSYLHGENCLHRDIKPSNIRIDRFGTPILIDFGAARQETQFRSRLAGSFRVVSDGFSPNEFYIAGAEQGAGSDLYSLAASLYHAIAGKTPAQADARAQKVATGEPDPYEPLSGRFPDFDPRLLEMIDRSMAMSLKDRPSSADEWLKAIADEQPAVAPIAAPVTAAAPLAAAEAAGSRGRSWADIGMGAVGGAVIGGLLGLLASPGGTSDTAQLQQSLRDTEASLGQTETALAAAQAEVTQLETRLAAALAGDAGGVSPNPGPQQPAPAGDIQWVGTWSLIAQCPETLVSEVGTSRIFGTLVISDRTGTRLTGNYVNNLGQSASLDGSIFGARVDWSAQWDDGSVTTLTMIVGPDGRTFTGVDTPGCDLTGSRRS